MPQTVWKGSISFGLVSIPVKLISATEEKSVSFRQVHVEDGGRIRYKRVCEIDGKEVEYSDIAKGYELPGGDMVVLTDEDLDDLPVTSSRTVEVVGFAPFEEIDPTSFSRPYYADPTGDAKPYVLLRDALEKSGLVGIVKIALRNRERLAVLRSREGVLVIQTVLWPDEVRVPKFDFLSEDVEVKKQEMAMAESYIETLTGDFEPDDYVDEYREAVLKVIDAKVEGAEVVEGPKEEEDEGQVVDLMDALRKSVAEAKKAKKPAAKKAPAKKAAKKSA